MARVATLLSTFNGGEWSPELYGRIDLDKYRNACAEVENFVLLPQGPATRRPGTRHVARTKNDGEIRLIPFEFSTEQTYVIEAGDFYFRFYMNGGRIENPPGTPHEIATPYSLAKLAQLKWAQSADVLYLCHPDFAPRKLSRTGHTSWTLTLADFQDGPYLDENVGPITLTPAAATGNGINLTASASLFVASDVGRLVRIKHAAQWGWAKIASFTSATVVAIDIKSTLGGVGAVTTWRLGAWSETTGWPNAVTFYEERLFLGNCRSQPQTLWASVSGAYESFAPSQADGTVRSDHALNFTIADDRVNAIRWMSAGKTLVIGTVGGEFNVAASSLNEALTPTNITVKRETTNGSADLRAQRIGRAVLYVQRAGRKLYEMAYSFESDAFNAPELSLMARHLTQPGIREITFQQEPWSILWVVRTDGLLLGLTYLREQDVVGWHRHKIGGQQVKVLSATTIAGPTEDELWLAVERRINGATQRSIERMAGAFLPADADDKADAFFVDAGLTFDGAKTQTLSPGVGATVIGTSNVEFTAGGALFGAGDVGREIHFRYKDALAGGYRVARAAISVHVSPTLVKATILSAFPNLTPIASGAWALSATSISGLAHLIGETVAVQADGATHPDRVVATDGSITLERPVAKAQVGLSYVSRLTSLDIEAGVPDGSAQGRLRRLFRVVLRLRHSLGARVGFDTANLEDIVFREGGMAMDQSPPLFTGDKIVPFPKGWSRAAKITVVQDQPMPCTIVALIPQISTMEG
jgi:hypothetical protein